MMRGPCAFFSPSMLANIIAEATPEYVGCAYDVGRKTFRTEMFPEYKAQPRTAGIA